MLGTVHNMTNDTSLESSYSLLLESLKKCELANINFFEKSSYLVKMFVPKIDKI